MTGDLARALAASDRGDVRLARRLLGAVIERGDIASPWACQQLVQSFVQRGSGPARAAGAERALRACSISDRSLLDLGLGYLARRRGRPAEARVALERAAAGGLASVAARIELGALEAKSGRHRAARRHLASAAKAASANRDRWGLAACLAQQAVLALEDGRVARAIGLAGRVAALRARLGDRLGLGFALQVEAKACYRAARFTPAFARLRQALELHTASAHWLEAAVVENNLGLWHLDLASPGLAAPRFRAARSLFHRLGDRPREAAVVANLANACRQAGDYAGAMAAYACALRLAAAGASPDSRCIAVAEQAELLNRWGRPARARALLGRERRCLRDASPASRAMVDVEAARALLLLGRPQTALARSTRACAAVSELPATALGRVTAEIKAGLVAALARLERGQAQIAAAELDRIGDRLDGLLASQDDAWVRMGLAEAHRDLHDARIRLALTSGPDRFRRAWAAAASLKARELRPRPGHAPRGSEPARATLPAGALLLEYHVAAATTWLFALDGREVRAFDLGVGERALGRTLERLLDPVRSGEASRDPRAAWLSFDLELAHRLYRLLVEPALSRLAGRPARLIIVPDGPLHLLPFELLVSALPERPSSPTQPLASFARARYLGDEHTPSYAHSSLLLQPPAEPATSVPGSFLGLSFSPPPGAVQPMPEGALPLGPLRRARREVELAGRCFARSVALHGPAASAAAYRRRAPTAEVIHFAAHAFADAHAPGASGIVLAGGPAGYLSAEAVRAVKLRAGLVTLSACDSGRGPLRAREGTVGLARAFLEAGADAVIATQWPVDDRAALDLMTTFYRCLAAGADRATALARARRALRARCGRHLFPPRAHPGFWAPFVLIDHAIVGGRGFAARGRQAAAR